MERVATITAERGLGLRSWADALIDKEENDGEPISLAKLDNKDLTAYDWHDVWEWGPSPAYKLANADIKVDILILRNHAVLLFRDDENKPM